IMAYHHVDFRIHFDMYGGENLAGTIVMHHKVMDAENPFKTQSRLFNLMNKLRIRSFSQKRAYSLSYQAYARPQDENGNRHSEITVNMKIKKMSGQNSCEDDGCG